MSFSGEFVFERILLFGFKLGSQERLRRIYTSSELVAIFGVFPLDNQETAFLMNAAILGDFFETKPGLGKKTTLP